MNPIKSDSTPTEQFLFETQLDKLSDAGNRNFLNGYLIVKNDGSLGRTHVLNYIFEKFKGFFRGSDRTNQHLVELKVLQFIKAKREFINQANIEKVKALATLVGLNENPQKGERDHEELHQLIVAIGEESLSPKTEEDLDDLIQSFHQKHIEEWTPFSKEIVGRIYHVVNQQFVSHVSTQEPTEEPLDENNEQSKNDDSGASFQQNPGQNKGQSGEFFHQQSPSFTSGPSISHLPIENPTSSPAPSVTTPKEPVQKVDALDEKQKIHTIKVLTPQDLNTSKGSEPKKVALIAAGVILGLVLTYITYSHLWGNQVSTPPTPPSNSDSSSGLTPPATERVIQDTVDLVKNFVPKIYSKLGNFTFTDFVKPPISLLSDFSENPTDSNAIFVSQDVGDVGDNLGADGFYRKTQNIIAYSVGAFLGLEALFVGAEAAYARFFNKNPKDEFVPPEEDKPIIVQELDLATLTEQNRLREKDRAEWQQREGAQRARDERDRQAAKDARLLLETKSDREEQKVKPDPEEQKVKKARVPQDQPKLQSQVSNELKDQNPLVTEKVPQSHRVQVEPPKESQPELNKVQGIENVVKEETIEKENESFQLDIGELYDSLNVLKNQGVFNDIEDLFNGYDYDVNETDERLNIFIENCIRYTEFNNAEIDDVGIHIIDSNIYFLKNIVNVGNDLKNSEAQSPEVEEAFESIAELLNGYIKSYLENKQLQKKYPNSFKILETVQTCFGNIEGFSTDLKIYILSRLIADEIGGKRDFIRYLKLLANKHSPNKHSPNSKFTVIKLQKLQNVQNTVQNRRDLVYPACQNFKKDYKTFEDLVEQLMQNGDLTLENLEPIFRSLSRFNLERLEIHSKEVQEEFIDNIINKIQDGCDVITREGFKSLGINDNLFNDFLLDPEVNNKLQSRIPLPAIEERMTNKMYKELKKIHNEDEFSDKLFKVLKGLSSEERERLEKMDGLDSKKMLVNISRNETKSMHDLINQALDDDYAYGDDPLVNEFEVKQSLIEALSRERIFRHIDNHPIEDFK